VFRSLITAKLLFSAILIATSAIAARAQVDTANPKPAAGNEVIQPLVPSKSKVGGRVIFADTGLPADDALVSLVNPKSPRPLGGMTTNKRGAFGLGGIPPGEYYVVAQSREEFGSGYPSIPNPFRTGDEDFDAARLEVFTRGFPKITVDGRNVIQLEIRIPRSHGGVISGQITGANSAAVPRASVTILRRLNNGLRTIEAIRAGDDGRFRVTRLPPGDYFVRALGLEKNEFVDVHELELPNAVYFSSTTDIKEAVPVTVLQDQETGSINISLETRKLATVSGLLRMGRSGKPLANVMVGLRGQGRDHIMNSGEDGGWSFSHVASGKYTLLVGSSGVSMPAGPPLPAQPYVHKYQELIVGESDIKDLVIELSQGGRISGTVMLEGSSPSKPNSIAIIASSLTRDGQNPAGARVNSDGSFSLAGVPLGEVTLRASIFPFKEYITKSIQWNGIDLLKEKLNVVEDSDIRNIVVVIAPAAPH